MFSASDCQRREQKCFCALKRLASTQSPLILTWRLLPIVSVGVILLCDPQGKSEYDRAWRLREAQTHLSVFCLQQQVFNTEVHENMNPDPEVVNDAGSFPRDIAGF